MDSSRALGLAREVDRRANGLSDTVFTRPRLGESDPVTDFADSVTDLSSTGALPLGQVLFFVKDGCFSTLILRNHLCADTRDRGEVHHLWSS